MRRHRNVVFSAIALVALALVSTGLATADCPVGTIARDSVTVESVYGSLAVDVCVVHHSAAALYEYRITVSNLSIDCGIQSFGMRPLPGVSAELEGSDGWVAEIDPPHWWMWDGPSSQAITVGHSRNFVFLAPDSTLVSSIAGAAFTMPGSTCGESELKFEVLEAVGGPEESAMQDDESPAGSEPLTTAAESYAHDEFVVDATGRGSFRITSNAFHLDNNTDEYTYTVTNIDYCGGLTLFGIPMNGINAIDQYSSTGWPTSIEDSMWIWEGLPPINRGETAEFSIILDGPSSASFGVGWVWAPPPCRSDIVRFEVLVPENPGLPMEDPVQEVHPMSGTVDCDSTGPLLPPAFHLEQVEPSRLSWTRLGGPPGGLGYDIRMNPENPDLMFVSDANAGLHMSRDGGRQWELVPVDPLLDPSFTFPCFCVTIDPNNPSTIWTGLKDVGGLWLSTDGGATWQERVNGFKESAGFTLRGITVEPGNSNVVYVAGELSSWVWAGAPRVNPDSGFDVTQGVVYKSIDQGRRWTEVWRGDNLARYVLIDPRDKDVIYVSTGIFDRDAANADFATRTAGGVGVLKSTDGGETWRVLDERNGLTGLYVGSLVMHPEDPATLMAGVGHTKWTRRYPGRNAPAGVFITHDGGETWSQELQSEFISSVEFAPGDPRIAYAAGDLEFYRSEDGGQTWKRISMGSSGHYWGPPGMIAGFPIDIEVDPRDPYRVFVNNYQGGNFLSEDGGETWTDASSGYSGATISGGLAVDPIDPARVFCGAFSGLFLSEDWGRTWRGLAFDPVREANPTTVALSPGNSEIILSAPWDANGLAFSSDGGYTRKRVSPHGFGQGTQYLDIAFSLSSPNIVYVAAGDASCLTRKRLSSGQCTASKGGVYRSEDCGQTWRKVSGSPVTGKSVAAVAVHPKDPSIVFAGTLGEGAYVTRNAGQSWMLLQTTLTSVRDIAISLSDPSIVYAVGFGPSGGVSRSEDGGATWKLASSGLDPEEPVFAVQVDPANPMIAWVAQDGRGISVSTTGGLRWAAVNHCLTDLHTITLSLSLDGSTLYAGTRFGGAFRLDLAI